MFRLIFIIYLFASVLLASKLAMYSEVGSYNKSYIDERIVEGKGNADSAISSTMYTLGGYYQGDFDNMDTIWGVGIVQTRIAYASLRLTLDGLDDFEQIIEQPETIITVPYVFIGLSKKYWSFEIGVSYYFNIENFKERTYYVADNKTEVVDDAGWDLNRYKSHTFINFKFRLLREDKFHIELLLARDKFSPVDSLLRFNFVLPIKNITLNTDISLYMPKYYFVDNYNSDKYNESDSLLKSNQRLTFGLDYKVSNFNIGANIGFLIKNAVGGTKSAGITSKFSAGLNISMSF